MRSPTAASVACADCGKDDVDTDKHSKLQLLHDVVMKIIVEASDDEYARCVCVCMCVGLCILCIACV